METRLYPQIDVSVLNDRYAAYKKKAKVSAAVFDREVEDALLDDEFSNGSEGDTELSNSYSNSIKETLFDEPYFEDEDGDYVEEMERNDFFEELDEGAVGTPPEETDTVWELALIFIFRQLHRVKKNAKPIILISIGVLCACAAMAQFVGSQSYSSQIIPNVKSFADISRSLQNLQQQINEINTTNKGKFHELRSYVNSKVEEAASKFSHVDDELAALRKEQKELLQRIESVELDGVNMGNVDKIPVVLDSNNNVQLLPEFEQYLQEYVTSVLKSSEVQREFHLNSEKFIQDYIEEIVNGKIGFMKKDEILSLIRLQFQEKKQKLIQEIGSLIQSQQVTNEKVAQRLISNKDHSKRTKINYALTSNGARIINYLTSPPFSPRTKRGWLSWLASRSSAKESTNEELVSPTSPLIVLTQNDGYWKSKDVNATLGIFFIEPIYINEFIYVHPRALNAALLTSCPRAFEVFVKTDDKNAAKLLSHNWKYSGDDTLLRDSHKYYKAMECEYDIKGDEEQSCPVPDELKRLLVKSVVVRARGNYDNKLFTSLYKFQVHGLTRFDLASVDKLLGNEAIGEDLKRCFRIPSQPKRLGDDDSA